MVGRPTRRPDRTTAVNSGRRRRRACAGNTSGGELLATLAPTAGDDRPARAGPHPQPEGMGLRPSAVVRLERALAHEVLPLHVIGAHPPADGCAWGAGEDDSALPRIPGSSNPMGTGRAGPQAPTSIAERRAEPAAARRPTGQPPASGPQPPDGAPGPRPPRRAATRPERAADRCRAVDG